MVYSVFLSFKISFGTSVQIFNFRFRCSMEWILIMCGREVTGPPFPPRGPTSSDISYWAGRRCSQYTQLTAVHCRPWYQLNQYSWNVVHCEPFVNNTMNIPAGIPAPIIWLFIGFAQCNNGGKHQFVRFHRRSIIFYFPVIIVTGGWGGSGKLSSVECSPPLVSSSPA